MPATKSYLGLAGFREHRRYPRTATALNYIKVGEGNGGIMMNISEEGMALTTAEGLVGEFVPLLRFRLSDEGNWIEASGRIVWLNETKKGAGIEFVEISDEDRDEIRRWVHSKISPEGQEPVEAPRKPSKEVESALITGPSIGPRAAQEPYEIQKPSLRKMFPSENKTSSENTQAADTAREARAETPPAMTSRTDFFPSEAELSRKRDEPTIRAGDQIESYIDSDVEPIAPASNARSRRKAAKLEESLPIHEHPRLAVDRTEPSAASAAVLASSAAVSAQPAAVAADPSTAEASMKGEHLEEARVEDAAPRRLRIPTFGYEPVVHDEVEEKRSSWRNWSRATTPSLKRDMSESPASGVAAKPPRAPSFGYRFSSDRKSDQKEEDWTKWVDPAAPSHRKHVGLAVLGVLLIAAAFTIGIGFGQGSLDGLIETVKGHIPDKFQPTSSTSNAIEPTAPESSMATSAPAAPDVTHIAKSTPSTPASDAPAGESSDTGLSRADKNVGEKNAAGDTANRASTPAEAAKKEPPSATLGPSPKVNSRESNTTGTEVTRNDSRSSSDARKLAKSDVTRNTAARNTAAANAPEEPGTVLVAATGNSKLPFRLTTEEKPVSASGWVAISSQASVLVPRGADAESAPKRLKPGALVFRVDPAYPKKVGRNEVQIVKLLANVGENGEVRNVQRLSGTPLLASAAISAVREWRYSPTLFDGRPVPTEQRITVAFRSR